MKITKSYMLDFSPEQVYNAWVSSDTVIAPATSMDIEPVVGGHYRLHMQTPEFSSHNEGRFLLVEHGKRVRYTWEWNNDGEVSEIDVTFSATPTGTRIDLVHSGFTNPQSVAMHEQGWDSYITGFAEHLKTS